MRKPVFQQSHFKDGASFSDADLADLSRAWSRHSFFFIKFYLPGMLAAILLGLLLAANIGGFFGNISVPVLLIGVNIVCLIRARGLKSVYNACRDKLGLTEEDIRTALAHGKYGTVYGQELPKGSRPVRGRGGRIVKRIFAGLGIIILLLLALGLFAYLYFGPGGSARMQSGELQHLRSYKYSYNMDEDMNWPITSIGPHVFSSYERLRHMKLGSKVITIKEEAFAGCKNLKSVTIPPSVTEISEQAFEGLDPKSITIRCAPGSHAEAYARKHGFKVEGL